jgi:hypothetical protein
MKIFLFIILLIVIGFPIYFMVLLFKHFKKYIRFGFTTGSNKGKTKNPKVDIKTVLTHVMKQQKK